MVLPKDDQCKRVIDMLKDEPTLNAFEYNFIQSNLERTEFTSKQRAVIAEMMQKYECS